MAELGFLLLGLFVGWGGSLLRYRQFSRMDSDEIKAGMVYTIHMLPDPEETFLKYVLQVVLHTFTGKGGRRATLTTLNGLMWHGFRSSTSLFTSRKLSTLPKNAKFVLAGPCYESTIKAFQTRNGERFNIIYNHCGFS